MTAPDELAAFCPLPEGVAAQGTDAWRDERCGFVTASKFGVIGNKADKLTKGAESYLLELVGEELTGIPCRSITTRATDHGTEYEPTARQLYEAEKLCTVQEVGFLRHPTEPRIGCSPDGLIGQDGTIEIKCPMTCREHVRALIHGMPTEHLPQVQGGLWVTGRKWCHFVSYHPMMPESSRLVIIQVARSEEYIADLSSRVVAFRDRLQDTLTKLAQETGEPF